LVAGRTAAAVVGGGGEHPLLPLGGKRPPWPVAGEGPRRDPGRRWEVLDAATAAGRRNRPKAVRVGQAAPRVGEGAPALPRVDEEAAARRWSVRRRLCGHRSVRIHAVGRAKPPTPPSDSDGNLDSDGMREKEMTWRYKAT
jgi:hypothetical protein